VEDDWENPTLGAWGLGWEVWLNGMEVTQFTYFQQVGGIDCKPITGEITYGLERLAMYLQGVDNVYDLKWTDTMSYGDVYHQNEVEQSAYNFEHSDADFLFTAFGAHEKQAKYLMEQQLALPAYEQVLKAAHTFNLLDARGAISVTERAAYIGRIRNLARAWPRATTRAASAWASPWRRANGWRRWREESRLSRSPHMTTQNLLVELFVEELPPKALKKTRRRLCRHPGRPAQGPGPGRGRFGGDAVCLAAPPGRAHHPRGAEGRRQGGAAKAHAGVGGPGRPMAGHARAAQEAAVAGADVTDPAAAVAALKRQGEGKAEALFYDSLVTGATLDAGLQKALDEALRTCPSPR
jgi:hypothetical protein